MAVHSFDIYAAGQRTRYNVDSECDTLALAKRKAIETLAAIALTDIGGEKHKLAYSVHVTDRDGALVYAVSLVTHSVDR